MARNAPATYGMTIDTSSGDADEFFTTVDGIEGVAQDCLHRLSESALLGPGGDEECLDLRRLCGMDASRLSSRGPQISEVLQRDERILTADVRPRVARGNVPSIYYGTCEIRCTTAAGPFRRVFAFSDLAVADITKLLEGGSE